MRRQPNFFSAKSSVPRQERVVPDVRSANILMNAHAKLGDIDSAQKLLEQMNSGNGEDLPKLEANLVTYNTLLDACQKAQDLDSAIHVKTQIHEAGLEADTRTYTTLIATVARKASSASGVNDPTLAFTFLEEMQNSKVAHPNGMTYSALIDVCGRCRRSDLALKGLRLMLDQKAHEQKALVEKRGRYPLAAEVGAWTAAIDACGKSGRLDTALRLFYGMPNFGIFPNTITCGCLTDGLLRQGRTAESLDILRYMKKHRIAPSEVMYTSLMTSAGKLAQLENKQYHATNGPETNPKNRTSCVADESGDTKAVEVYTELMGSLMHSKKKRNNQTDFSPFFQRKENDSSELFRVSLVFQEMKAVGVEPDLACYNAFLKSCANSGDVERAIVIFEQIQTSEDMEPNDKTWGEMIRAAGKAGRVDVALKTWHTAVNEASKDDRAKSRRLSLNSLSAFVTALTRSANDDRNDSHTKRKLYQVAVRVYEACISDSSYLGMNLVDKRRLNENARLILMFLQSIVAQYNLAQVGGSEASHSTHNLQKLAAVALSSPCLSEGIPANLQRSYAFSNAYKVAKSWHTIEGSR